jgi:hypothetical protein
MEGMTILGVDALWSAKDFPHTGWSRVLVEDLGKGATMLCEACAVRHIRYVHHLRHDGWRDTIRVGCICRGHLSADLKVAKTEEVRVRSASKAAEKRSQKVEREKLDRIVAEMREARPLSFRHDALELTVWRYAQRWHVLHRPSSTKSDYDDLANALKACVTYLPA